MQRDILVQYNGLDEMWVAAQAKSAWLRLSHHGMHSMIIVSCNLIISSYMVWCCEYWSHDRSGLLLKPKVSEWMQFEEPCTQVEFVLARRGVRCCWHQLQASCFFNAPWPEKVDECSFWLGCLCEGGIKNTSARKRTEHPCCLHPSFSFTTLWKRAALEISSLLTPHLPFCGASASSSFQSTAWSEACVLSVTLAVHGEFCQDDLGSNIL